MLVKKYQAKDMQEAMDAVIKELGSDAVILNSRKVKKKGLQNIFSKPVQEVMVAYDPAKIPNSKKSSSAYAPYIPNRHADVKTLPAALTAPSNSTQKLPASSNALSQLPPASTQSAQPYISAGAVGGDKDPLTGLNSRIESLDNLLNNFMSKFSYVKREVTYDYSEEVEDLVVRLIDNEVLEELVHIIAKEAEQLIMNREGTSAREAMEHLITEKIGAPSPITHKKFTQKVILVVGPTGVGKTTSTVKLAANFAVKQKKKVGIINTDTYRIAAQEQLRTYADILGVPLSIVYQISEIEAQLEAMRDRELIFIDTAGKRPGDEQHKEDISNIIEFAKPEEILLCVSATTSFKSIKEIVDTYSFIKDYKLLVTKLDETQNRGVILNLSWYTQRRLAYVTVGQNVPDDIEDIEPASIVGQILS